MEEIRLKRMQLAHFILLFIVVLLFLTLQYVLDNDDILLKILSYCSFLIGGMWGVILLFIALIKGKNESEHQFLSFFYKKLLVNHKFLIISNTTLFTLVLGLFTFFAVFQVVEFRTDEFKVEVFLSRNDLQLEDPGYQSLGITMPGKPLKVRLSVGKKRFSFASLSEDKKKDAKIIRLRPFNLGRTQVYQVNMH